MINIKESLKEIPMRIKRGFMLFRTKRTSSFDRVINDPELLMKKLNNPNLDFYPESIQITGIRDMGQRMEISIGKDNQLEIKKTKIIIQKPKVEKKVEKKSKKKAAKKKPVKKKATPVPSGKKGVTKGKRS